MENIAKKIKHGIKWQFIANMITTVLYFVNGIILARILLPKDFGLYGMAQILSTFIFMFWNLGINSAIIQRKEISDKHLQTAFTISLIMGFICFLITWISAPYLARYFGEPSITLISRLIGITFLIYALDRVPSALLGRNLFFKNISLVGIANPILYGLVAIPLALIGFGPVSFAWGIIAGTLGMVIIRIYWGLKLFKWKPKILFDKEAARHLLGFGVFLTMSGIINFFSSNLQRIITGKFLGSISLGYFTKASHLGEMPALKVKSNIITVLLPGFSSIQHRADKIRDWFKKFNFFTYGLISPGLIFIAFFPREVIVGLFGQKWLPSAGILHWLSLSVLIEASVIYFKNILNATGRPHLPFIIGLVLLIPVTIGLLIGVKWGITGIAIVIFMIAILRLVSNLAVLHFSKLVSIKDFIISAFEPILISLLSCTITYLIYQRFKTQIGTAELRIIALLSIHGIIIISYCCYRWFKKSFIAYLGFDMKKVVKL